METVYLVQSLGFVENLREGGEKIKETIQEYTGNFDMNIRLYRSREDAISFCKEQMEPYSEGDSIEVIDVDAEESGLSFEYSILVFSSEGRDEPWYSIVPIVLR